MDHRGRFQAQGGGIQESEPWDDPDPLTGFKAHHLLAALKSKIPQSEAALRGPSFLKAHGFIDRCAAHGGIGPTKQTWPKPSRKDSRRVDIEVQSGRAFV
jgi:hypothetical protein